QRVRANAEIRAIAVFRDQIIQSKPGSITQWGAVILIGHAHVDQAVERNAVPSQTVIYRSLLVFRFVDEVGCHRIRRFRWSCRSSGLLCWLRFKFTLPPLELCYAFR